MTEKILVIKSGALGDFIRALGEMEALRRYHSTAHITLLTTRPFLDIAQRSEYFDDVIVDPCPKFYELHLWYSLFEKLSAGRFTCIYDLRLDKQSAAYYRKFLQETKWLDMTGFDVRLPDISWMKSDIRPFKIKKPYVLLVPGSSPRHPARRWPVKHYGALALRLVRDGYQPVILGTEMEMDVTDRIAKSCPETVNLCDKTSLYDIASLAREARGAIGGDTGPIHLIALTGCPVIALFCTAAASAAPKGRSVQVIEADDLSDLPMNDVYKKFSPESETT